MSSTKILYNTTSKEGDLTSLTAFIGGESFVATPEHPNWESILRAFEKEGISDPAKAKGLFNLGRAIASEFKRFSERVTFAKGQLFFDGDVIDDGLAQTIVRYHASGEDYMPLVNFLEKIATNPLEHSRQQLFSWLRSKHIGLCPDGDFIAYKSVESNFCSVHSGEAFVNGVLVKGKIPNKPDTIIEMPRSKVAHAPDVACSTGLHAANWSFARGFASGPMLVLKINPRDVVSVPRDHGADKIRVCRYKVLRQVQAEDNSVLFIPDVERIAKVPTAAPEPKPEPPKRERPLRGRGGKPKPAPKPEPKPEHVFPDYYEQFKKRDFDACPMSELRWIAKEFELTGYSKMDREELTPILIRTARARLRTWG